jgi:hypothetical protein
MMGNYKIDTIEEQGRDKLRTTTCIIQSENLLVMSGELEHRIDTNKTQLKHAKSLVYFTDFYP